MSEQAEADLLDYWRVVWTWRRMVFGLALGAALVAMIVSLMMPKMYAATATILPPLQAGQGMGLSGGAAAAAMQAQSLGMLFPTMPATPIDLFLAMLGSQTVATELIEKFDLQTYYKSESEEDAIKALKEDTKVATTPEKVITVTVEARTPQLAADLANAYIAALDQLNRNLTTGKAGQHRQFVERRLAEGQTDLVEAERKLAAFQTRSKAVALPEQASAAIKAAAEIQARIIAVEVQAEVLQNYLAPGNPDLVKLKLEQEQLTRQLHMLESGEKGKGMLPGDRLHPAFVTVPSLGMEYAKLLRDVKVQETLFTLLTSQYEQAKIEESRDTPTVQMLDKAKPPVRKSRPKIKLNMAIAGALGLLTGAFLAFILEAIDRRRAMQNQPPIQPWSSIVFSARKDELR
jgi:uncharacterized protein involved in exopolysaccharide biosynthesis